MLKVAVAMDAQELSETHDDRDFDDTWGDLHADGVGGWQGAKGAAGVGGPSPPKTTPTIAPAHLSRKSPALSQTKRYGP